MKIAILGYGVEGKSVENYFKNHGEHEFEIFDNFTVSDVDSFNLDRFDLVFRTPSVHPREAKNWTSITKYFFDHCPAKIIGVTGTKGKGTTCSMTAAILKNILPAESRVFLIGNIGLPALDILDELKPTDYIVYEMSSFQLWDLEKSPSVAGVLRIEPDHLNVHDDYMDYVHAKSNITMHQIEHDSLVYYKDNQDSAGIALTSPAGHKYVYPTNSTAILDLAAKLNIPGEHNRENAEAAIMLAAATINLDPEVFCNKYHDNIQSALANFPGLPHRCEFVRELNGVRYYDDNYSSAFPAMDVAIKAFNNNPVVLIAGGKDRGLDLTAHKSAIFGSANIKKAILIGETREKLAANEDPSRYEFADDLETAVKRAKEITEDQVEHFDSCVLDGKKQTAIVLMSPGAASFDMFNNFKDRGEQFQNIVRSFSEKDTVPSGAVFEFKNYYFDPTTFTANFSYRGADGIDFTEKINFAHPNTTEKGYLDPQLLDRALFLSFILIGTSYYKVHPTKTVKLSHQIDKYQAHFFNTVYQEGLSQYAFENNLTRSDLVSFKSTTDKAPSSLPYQGTGILSLQSGGKDSLLTAKLLEKSHQDYSFWYLGSSENYPDVLNELSAPLQTALRAIDRENLKKSLDNNGKNGHVPITYIVQSLALIQAILNNQNTVLTSIGQEGNEAHAYIDDLAVNHQWSKTWPAEQAFADYVRRYISEDIHVGSPLRGYSELKIAELFVNNCWSEYGHKFSSCNVANYQQSANNQQLSWCGDCPKCANSYLLFAPFLDQPELDSIFNNQDLFKKDSLTNTFKGLLGIDNHMKPFECIGEVQELRTAYHMKRSDYSDLPFEVPAAEDFDYNHKSSVQNFINELFED